MKILLFTDPHCTRSSEFSKPTEDGYNEYLQLFFSSFDFVEAIVNQTKPDVLAFGGDFWDDRDYVDTLALNTGFKVWEKMSKLPVKYKLAVVGNHDYFDIENQIHTLQVLKGFGWTVFEEIGSLELDGVHIVGLPYRDTYEISDLMDLADSAPDVVLSHCDVVGGMLRAPRNDKDKRAFTSDGVPPDLFDSVGVVLNGHYHHPSKVSRNWYNVGSLTSRTFHDKDSSPRGVAVYDTETGVVERYTNPYARSFVDVHVESEEDLMDLLDKDFTNTYARLYYNMELEDEIQVARESFAGARLLPLTKKQSEVQHRVDLKVSLQENLESYIDSQYSDEDLKLLALDIFAEAAADHAVGSSREPLEFGTLEINNFLSIGSVTIDLRNRGLVFLGGINADDPGQDGNGAGKSNIGEAIWYVLKGKTFKKLTSAELVHWKESHMRVSLEVFSGGEAYTIVRSRKDPEYGTGVKLFKGAASIGARLSSDTKKKVEDLVGRSDASLKNVCFLTSGMDHCFTQLSNSQRIKLLEDIVDAQPYVLAQKLADEKLVDTRLDLARVRGRLEAYTSQQSHLESEIDILENKILHIDDIVTESKSRIESEIHDIENELIALTLDSEKKQAELSSLGESITTLQTKREAWALKTPALRSKYTDLKSEQMSLEGRLNKYKNLDSIVNCPTCDQFIDKARVGQDISSLKSLLETCTASVVEAFNNLDKIESRVSSLDAAIGPRLDELRRGHSLLNSIYGKISDKNDLISLKRSEIANLDNQVTSLESSLSDLKQQLTTLLQKAVEDVELEESLETRESLLGVIHSEVFHEKGVRSALISQVAIPYLNSRIPEYSQYLWGGRELRLTAYKELKNGTRKSEIGILMSDNRSQEGNSKGEKNRVDLVIQLSLHDLAGATGHSKIGFVLVDEVLDHLDESGIYAAKEALRQKGTGTILLVSHRKYAASICPRKLILIKEDKYTRILEDHTQDVISA